ncbi:thermonuclease family protein [Kroppenstedtia eburnea]|uniref:thermonuclease family protein n=1 Tax=Kroppenstedtia eburnea TaxID=714067 RepID=UPI00020C9B20|nr:thermonuclease [Desmospora sp. 8437]
MRNRKKWVQPWLWLWIVLLLVGCQSGESAGTGEVVEGLKPPAQGLEEGRVIRVIDGDTAVIETGGKKEKVRFIGVNTPETNHPKIGVEYYGKEASNYTKDRLDGKEVRLELDVEKRDRYGRLLAYLWMGDELFNATLVKEGYARIMTVPPNVKYQETFLRLEREARKKDAGLWRKEDGQEAKTGQDGDCVGKIKGNINRKGEKIYHTRMSPQYDETKPERWFCTEREAEEAGFRAPANAR